MTLQINAVLCGRRKSNLIFALASLLLVAGCDSYDSFSECMTDHEARAASAHAVCPECENDWSQLRRDAVQRCSKYR